MEISRRADLTDQVAIVTGAARGIGRAAALGLAREGAHVVVADVLPGQETVAEVMKLGRRAVYAATDVTRRGAVNAMVQRALAEFGRIDILVNNAATVARV